MNTKEIKEKERLRDEAANKAYKVSVIEHNKRVKIVSEDAKKATNKALQEIYNKVNEAVAEHRKEISWYETYTDSQVGGDYLITLKEELVKRLEKDGYMIEYAKVEYNSATIYEGTMNPEAVGSEYCNHSLYMKISW